MLPTVCAWLASALLATTAFAAGCSDPSVVAGYTGKSAPQRIRSCYPESSRPRAKPQGPTHLRYGLAEGLTGGQDCMAALAAGVVADHQLPSSLQGRMVNFIDMPQ